MLLNSYKLVTKSCKSVTKWLQSDYEKCYETVAKML